MCDQTEVAYLPNDIVWVKLSNVWWPAEVQDESKLDEDVTAGLKKKPLAIVKFFDEDLYEFPKNLNQIYHYNCLRKDEFIKKGLDLWRAELSRDIPYSMKKFPQDVQVAEEKSGGNPNYIDDPKFLPEEKLDYRENFGLKPLKKLKDRGRSITPLPKHPRKSSTPSPKVTFSTPLSVPSTSRALGAERKTPNSAKKSRSLSTPPSILKDPHKIKKKEEVICSYFPCVFCNYSCKRINNAVSHIKAHLRGLVLPPPNVIPTKYESVFEENQKKKTKKILSPEPVARPHTEKVPQKRKSSPELPASSKKKKQDSVPKKEKTIPPPSNPPISADTVVNAVSIYMATSKKRSKKQKITKEKKLESTALEILKDWDDESNADDHDMEVIPAIEESFIAEKTADSLDQSIRSESGGSGNLIESPASPLALSEPSKTPEKSCFDFEDTDESLNLDQSLKFGQKLPRVINDKQSTTGRFKHGLKPDATEDDLSKDVEGFLEKTNVPVLPEIPPPVTVPALTTSQTKQDLKADATEDDLTKDVEGFLKSANVPVLPEIPPSIKVSASTTGQAKEDLQADATEDDLSKDVEGFLISANVPVLPELPSSMTVPASTTGQTKQDLKADATEDDLAKDVEDFLGTANVPVLPEVPSVTVQASELEPQLEKKECQIKGEMETFKVFENEKPLLAEDISDSQPAANIMENSSLVEEIPCKEMGHVDNKKIEDINDITECEVQDKTVLVDVKGSHDLKNDETLSSDNLVEKTEGALDSTATRNTSQSVSLDDKTTMESISSTIEEVSAIKGKFEEKPLNLDLSEDCLKNETICEVSEIDSAAIPMSKVDKKSNTIKSDLPLLFCDNNTIKEDKKSFPDNESTQKLAKPTKQADKEDLTDVDNNCLPDENTAIKYVEDKIDTTSGQISLGVRTTNQLEKKEVDSVKHLKLEVGNGVPFKDKSSKSVKNDISNSSKELSKDVSKCSESKGALKLDYCDPREASFKIDNQKLKSNKDISKSLNLTGKKRETIEKKKEVTEEKKEVTEEKKEVTEEKKEESIKAGNILSSELSSDNTPLKKSANLVSESSLLKIKSEEIFKQIELSLNYVNKKETTGVVRKISGNDNRLIKKRKIENDTTCKHNCNKDIKEKSSSNEQIKELQDEKSIASAHHDIDIADIPLPVDEYPVKAEPLPQNKKSNQVSKPDMEEASEIKEELQPSVSEVSVKKEPQNQIISPDQEPLDINSMPVVFASDVPKPMAEYCFGKKIPRHPNADIIRIRLVPQGQEKFIKLRPGEHIRKKITIRPDPNYKPCHNLKRIPFPTHNNEPLPADSQASSVETIQGPSTSFAVPGKPVGNNVVSIKSGVPTVNFSGKIPIKSNVKLLSPGQKVLMVPTTSMGTVKLTVANSQSTVTSGRLVKPKTADKVQKKTTKQIIVNKTSLSAVAKNIPISKTVYGHIKGVSPSALPLRNQRVLPASKVSKPGQPSGVLMKPPSGPAPKIMKTPASTVKVGSTVFVQSSQAVSRRSLTSTTSSSGSQLEKKTCIPKLKQSSPNILQKSPKKPVRQIPVSSTQMAATSSQPQASEIVSVSSLPTIVQSETSQTAGEQVVLLTLDEHGNCIPANQILPIGTNESLINIDSTSASGNIDNFLLTNYIKIGSPNTSSSSKKSGTQDILAEALANTQVLQSDTSELSEVDGSVYQQFPTTSLASSVLETSLTLNQPPIMSPLEVPSSVNTQALQIKGKNPNINPSMPLLTDDILSDSSSRHTSHVTFQLVDDDQIVVSSSGDELTDTHNQIMFASEMLPGQEQSNTTQVSSHSTSAVAKEDNILPEFLRVDFSKKSQKAKRNYLPNNDDR